MADLNLTDIERLPIDFEEIMQLLKNRVQSRLPNRWTDFLASNFGVELLEAFAYEATLMNYYINSSINECFLPTAKTKTGVYSLAKTIGYNPKPPSQAIVKLKFYLDTPYNKNIIIPKYTKLSSSSGIPFYTTENKVLYVGETFVEVEAKSGTLVEESLISSGIPRDRYKLRQFPVNSVEYVSINDELYKEIDFIDVPGQDKYFMLEHDDNFYGYISFGDGNYGVNPGKNLIIDVLYVIGADSSHNVMPFQITNISDLIYDAENNVVNNIKVVNEQSANGASDGESLAEVKRNASSIYRTQKRCVTRQDYEDLTYTLPGVKKVSVIDHSLMDEIGIFGVKIAVIPENQRYPTDSFKQYVKNFLEEKKIVATQVDIIDPSYITFDVKVSISIQQNMSSSVISNKIREIVNNYLGWENRDFGEDVSKLELYRLISEIPGITNINNLTLEENRSIYVTEAPADGSNTIKYFDSINMLRIGAEINILDLDSNLVLSTKVIDINDSLSEITIADTIRSEMNIGVGSLIYPVLITAVNHQYGEKEISFSLDSSITGGQINYSLLNFSNITIYFADSPNKRYKVLFRIGNKLYLNEPIDRDIPANTKIIILSKKYTPTLVATLPPGSDVFYFNDYPRFDKGAELIKSSMISFVPDTVVMTRRAGVSDYMNSIMNDDYLARINQIYTDNLNVFTEGIDYNLLSGDKIIEWTATGRAKLPANSKYYIDIIKKVIDTSDSDIIYYVKSINKKTATVTPMTNKKLDALTTFEYISDTYKLLPNEISDVGIVSITII